MPDSTPLKVEAGLMLCMLLAITGCTAAGAPVVEAAHVEPPPAATPMPTEGRPMSAPDTRPPTPEPPDGPQLTPEQVWRKLMGLIDSLRDETDLNRGHIERAIGLPLAPDSESPATQGVYGKTTAGWSYIFELTRYSDDDVRASFGAYLPDLDTSTRVSPTCTFPLRELHEALLARGFKATDLTSEFDRSYQWVYDRDRFGLTVHYYFRSLPGDYDATCVDYVVMSYAIPPEKLWHE